MFPVMHYTEGNSSSFRSFTHLQRINHRIWHVLVQLCAASEDEWCNRATKQGRIWIFFSPCVITSVNLNSLKNPDQFIVRYGKYLLYFCVADHCSLQVARKYHALENRSYLQRGFPELSKKHGYRKWKVAKDNTLLFFLLCFGAGILCFKKRQGRNVFLVVIAVNFWPVMWCLKQLIWLKRQRLLSQNYTHTIPRLCGKSCSLCKMSFAALQYWLC